MQPSLRSIVVLLAWASTGLSFAASAASAPADDALFPRYAVLEPNVRFWTDVFAKYSEHQSVVHPKYATDKVLKVLDFRGDAVRLNKAQLARLKSKTERAAKHEMAAALKRVHAKRANPSALNVQDRRIYQMFPESMGDRRFLTASQTLRTQRGLRERTRRALEISGHYLPEMERVFASYGLPKRLTRLPLVESSFNVAAYSKVGAAGLWQFIPSSARIYMRLNEVVDDRRDPWTSTDAAARHLRDDYEMLGQWPLALTAYNFGRGGVARGLKTVGGSQLPDLIHRYKHRRFGFASRNFYAEFLAASDVEREWRKHFGDIQREAPIHYEVVKTRDYVPYPTLQRLARTDAAQFRKLNPAYRPEVMDGKLYVPPGHQIRVPKGQATRFKTAYANLSSKERFSKQRAYWVLHRVRRGDTLGVLARRHGTSVRAIQAANGMGRSTNIRLGRVIKIPPRGNRGGSVTVASASSTKLVKTAARRSTSTHRVRSGQTLSAIARQHGVSVKALRAANGMGRSSFIRAGQRLKLPSGARGNRHVTHTVRRGQTLSQIARSYRVSVNRVRQANGMGRRSSFIKAGQKLRIPVS